MLEINEHFKIQRPRMVIYRHRVNQSAQFFLWALFVYVFFQILTTTYITSKLPHLVNMFLMYLPIVLLLLKNLLFKSAFKTRGVFAFSVCFAGLCFIVGRTNENLFSIMLLFFLIVSSIDVDFEDIIRWQLFALCMVLVVTFGACFCGFIPNETLSHLGKTAYCFGFQYYTTLPNVVFASSACWLYLHRYKGLFWKLLFIWVVNWYTYKLSTTLHTFICASMFVVLVFMFECIKVFNIKHKVWAIISAMVFPSAAVLSFVAAVLYPTNTAKLEYINEIMNNRIIFMSRGIVDYGIHLFGSAFTMYGAQNSSSEIYNYIDNGYIYCLLAYGIVLFLLVILAYSYCTYVSSKRNDTILVCWAISIAFFGLSNQILLNLRYNPILYLLMPLLLERWIKHRNGNKSERGRYI